MGEFGDFNGLRGTKASKNTVSIFILLKVEGFGKVRVGHSRLVPETRILLRLLRIN